MIAALQKAYSNYLLKPFLKEYLKKERSYIYEGIRIKVPPGVFHPGYFFSTRVLLQFVKELSLKGLTFCEAGCGSGIISLLAYRNGARVLSFDINTDAVTALEKNFTANFTEAQQQTFKVLASDMFEKLPDQKLDVMVINPPYFFKDADSAAEQAWNCGKDGIYFHKLFSGMERFIHNRSKIFMILADNCDIIRIEKIAAQYNFSFELCETKKIKWEKNYIFKINLRH